MIRNSNIRECRLEIALLATNLDSLRISAVQIQMEAQRVFIIHKVNFTAMLNNRVSEALSIHKGDESVQS